MYVDPYHQRVAAGASATLSWQLIGADGEPADPGTVTVTVTRADGTVLATAAATSGTGTAARTYALTAAQTVTLDRLTAVWTASAVNLASTEIDVVGAPWFSNAELRTAEPAVSNTTNFPAAKITLARLAVEGFFERTCGRRFSPGYTLETRPAYGTNVLVVSHPDVRTVRSAAIYYDLSASASETLGATELAAFPHSPSGVLTRYSSTWGSGWVTIGYESGLATPPADVKRQAMRLCRELLVNEPKGQVPDNATSWQSSETGWSAVLVTPGVRGAHTRLPSVNECIDFWTFEQFGVA